jgi:uncharacterized coiled-coil protein SlyX
MDEDRNAQESHNPELEPEVYHPEVYEGSSAGLKITVVALAFLGVIALGYGWLQHDAAQQLASERAELRASLTQAKGQADALTAKVNALSAAQALAEAAKAAPPQTSAAANEQFSAQTAEAPKPKHTVHHVAHRAPPEDPRWKQFQSQLGDQQKELTENEKQIAETQANLDKTKSDLDQAKTDLNGNLQSARTELGGAIARNHDELVTLERKGERTYYEFSVEKSKAYHHTGPISIALRKADTKHDYCDLQMLVDDKEISRKHVNLYESISFYPQGYPQAVEVVINGIEKDSIKGYVSEPKYKTTEHPAAAAAPAATTSDNSSAPNSSAPEAKLEQHDQTSH